MADFIAATIGSSGYWENFRDSLSAAGIGILLTFVVLFVMIGVLVVMHLLFSWLEKREHAKREKSDGASQDEVTAAITGAISAYRDDEEVKINVKSIKKL